MRKKKILDSINLAYCNKAPYDYAFIGMRFGAASHEVLAQLGVLHRYSLLANSLLTPYPKRLRNRVFKLVKLRC